MDGLNMTRRTAIALGGMALGTGVLAACGSNHGSDDSAGEGSDGQSDEEKFEQKVADTVASLTLEQKVAQLFFLKPEALTGVGQFTAAGDATRQAIQDHPVGGLCYFKDNLQDAGQTSTMLGNTSRYSQDAIGLPIFLSVDEEGGTVSRIGGNPGFDISNVGDMADIGATGDADEAHDACQTIAEYLVPLGFNLDFAPDADIVNGTSQTMAKRSFGKNADVVAPMVEAAVRGFSDGGILCCAKHFPGIGSAEGDSETEPITTDRTLGEMRSEELRPFQSAIDAGVPFIMVGHLSCPKVTGDDTPASLSHAIISDVLRGELGYDGIVITDSLSMGAVAKRASSAGLCIAALEAGADMLLMPSDFESAYQGVFDAVRDGGTIDEERIDESLARIVRTKLRMQG